MPDVDWLSHLLQIVTVTGQLCDSVMSDGEVTSMRSGTLSPVSVGRQPFEDVICDVTSVPPVSASK